MKKFLLLCTMLFAFAQVWAQERTVSGTVVSEEGEPLPGVNVLLQGTSLGTVTDLDGNYRLSVPSEGGTLVFSFIGLATKEVPIGNRSVVDVTMTSDVTQLTEVVVTALGISREESSLGYAVQQVEGEQLNMVNEQNIVSSLTGKVAGVQVIGSSTANIGGSTKIRLRGATTLGETSPLFVVDGTPISNNSFGPTGRTHYSGQRDYGNLASDINPNDIESVTVLKGPSAAALYGQRGANGVILITTKKGKKDQGIGVTFNHSTTFDRVYILPDYQNEYAGGYTQNFSTFNYDPSVHPESYAAFNGDLMLNYAADESWGPRIDGTPIRHWDSWFPGETFGETRPLVANPDNVRDFFNTGTTINNNISFSGGTDNSTFRLSLGAVNQGGVLPNSELDRYSVNFNGTLDLSERLTAAANINYVNTQGQGRPALGYGTGPVSSMNQWFQRQLDMDRLRNYKNPDGTHRFWNIRGGDIALGVIPEQPLYWDNPYWDLFENVATDNRDRLYGNIALTYNILDNLSITGFLRQDEYTLRIQEVTASGGLNLDRFEHNVFNGKENNFEFLSEYNTAFSEDLDFNATFGGNIRKNINIQSSQETSGGLSTPNYFDIAASVDRPILNTHRQRKEVRSLYGSASFGFRDFLYLDVTGRQDWSSSLPEENNGYFYPSASLSLVFSELLDSEVFSFGKVRASVARVGSDIDPYNINQTYAVGNPFGSNAVLMVEDALQNSNLKPQLSTNIEAGIDVRFLNNRVGLDVNVYRNNVEDQILNLTVPGASGVSTAWVNAGEIESKGIEVVLSGEPVRAGNFTWSANLNFARNRSTVLSLAEGLNNRELQLLISDRWGGLRLNARVGEEWGQLTGGGFRYFQATDTEGNPVDHPGNGQRVVTSSGVYALETNKDLGSILPDFTGGFRNNFIFRNFNLNIFFDFQRGGQFMSITRMFNAYSGLGAETVGNNDRGNPMRDPVDDGGGVHVVGVDSNGDPVDTYTEAITYYGGLFGRNENWLYDASYIKLREVRLGYSLPETFVGGTPFSSINLALIARNLWLIHSNVDGIDPSEIAEGVGGFNAVEGGVLPGVRSLGFNIRVGL